MLRKSGFFGCIAEDTAASALHLCPDSLFLMERVMGIEPTLSAWEAEVLPLNYTRRLDFGLPLSQR